MPERNPFHGEHRDRREAPRVRPVSRVSGTVARQPCVIDDISAGGARVRHIATLNPGSRVRLQFAHGSSSVNVEARVRATTMVAMGDAFPYSSRLEFVYVDEQSRTAIRAATRSLEEATELRWIRNARGVVRDYSSRALEPVRFFTRMTRHEKGWNVIGTVSPAQPANGITIPADTPPHEADLLRRSWDVADGFRRRLIQEMARAACQRGVAGDPTAPASSS